MVLNTFIDFVFSQHSCKIPSRAADIHFTIVDIFSAKVSHCKEDGQNFHSPQGKPLQGRWPEFSYPAALISSYGKYFLPLVLSIIPSCHTKDLFDGVIGVAVAVQA